MFKHFIFTSKSHFSTWTEKKPKKKTQKTFNVQFWVVSAYSVKIWDPLVKLSDYKITLSQTHGY